MAPKNFGILASIDWNSNKWRGIPAQEDLDNSNFGYVQEHGITYTCLNFGHELYPQDEKGYYCGLLPQLWSRMPDKDNARYVEVVFIKSFSYKDNCNFIIGVYAFPQFKSGKIKSPLKSFTNDLEVNVRALPKDIYLLENYVNLKNHPDLKKFLPDKKELGKQGYNYLTKANVFKILDAMSALNPESQKLINIKYRLITTINRII